MTALRDWRTTAIGILIAAMVVAALITRPTWGVAEIVTFVGAIGTAFLGIFTKFPASSEPEKPPAPVFVVDKPAPNPPESPKP